MPVRKARQPAVTAKPAKATAKTKVKPVNVTKTVPVRRAPAAVKPEPITLAAHTLSAAAWNVIRQLRHLHLWQARGRSCECKLCCLVKKLQIELERNGYTEPKEDAQ